VSIIFIIKYRPYPLWLDFHGNAGNRAASFRIQAYKMFIALGINVVAIDYRGFGDSQGTPSEEGLYRDARATYRWVRQKQSCSEGDKNSLPAIYIAGQSMGTGVAARLALDLYRVGEPQFVLSREVISKTIILRTGEPPHTIFLIAPYTSIRNLLTTYKIGGLLPLFWPLGIWKVLSDLTDKYLYSRFESEKALYQLIRQGSLDEEELEKWGKLDYTLSEADLAKELGLTINEGRSTEEKLSPPNIIIAHADDDGVIPYSHGRSLLDTMILARSKTGADQKLEEERQDWGSTLTLQDKDNHRSYILVKSHKGGHNGFPQYATEIFSNIAGLT
jgi:pimeloyl-ACP methyl ester carboxylesterase